MRSVPSRRRLPSTASVTHRALAPRWLGSSSMGAKNLVAMTTSSRCPARARPRYSSDLVPPYTSAVSKKVMPASRAACTTFLVPSPSSRIPKLLHPRPTSDTFSVPSLRVSMGRTLRGLRQRHLACGTEQRLLGHRHDQGAVAGVHGAAGQPARAEVGDGLDREQQPVVGAGGTVEPDGVVEAGPHEPAGRRGAGRAGAADD